ncbi:hypothetical protein GCM10022251_37670 [Phytohabitans flavus]|uniref:Uncharacterized protein n=1 Tax=Phytohabitans flavus TaxID=1076124 RepID=A0A6F8XW02_9ACTN|nr:Gfo/Idh/MocA family oxidoreductase [Phytohabitans flavus]BCB77918.1 hypothetical protein Pflav_043280 [Phytohabitans flavus]
MTRVAVVGAGWVTVNRHLPSLSRHPGVRVVGMVTPEPPQVSRAELARRHGLTRYGATLDEPWLRDEVDAVVIGTPPDTHADLVCAALERGLHVLVEKPFALTTEDADRMIGAAKAADRRLAVIHNLQYGRAATRARALLTSGRLGDLRAAFGVQSSNHRRRLPSWYPKLPLGLFTDEAPHLIYLLQSFVPGAQVRSLHVGPAFAPDDNTPDLVSVVLRGGGQAFGSLQMTFVGAISEWLLVLAGSRATAMVDFFRDVCVVVPDDGGHRTFDVLRTQVAAAAGHAAGTVAAGSLRVRGRLDYGNDEVVRRFIAAVRDPSQDLAGISAERGRDVVTVLAAAHGAAGSHG